MTSPVTPWGLTRMKPFPSATALPYATVVLDPETQTGRWIDRNGIPVPVLDKHKRSETSKETETQTSLDGKTDQGHDQKGDYGSRTSAPNRSPLRWLPRCTSSNSVWTRSRISV
ncbi:putative ATP-grasp-modified RiPP [Streptomyces katsurahamanus]|uniref:ATP-grasp-modified RiPP n=1 Tax=Streptomyces katsurahamanus TaxID=2577098 RepID=A0ABW9P183_9ACTN|nr:putative ATP-grasp-modified RiPP [Streptomyces katsurahamanus]MQS39353.1 putative ATP-grasp-modified RiPP [Streptomyces katsurahamanus]